jgi:hypothetical protein
MEQISGPFNGFYIATYASDAGGPGINYLGYAKICRGRPDSYWDALCCAKVCGVRLHDTPQGAIIDAEGRARAQTDNLEPFAASKPARTRRRVGVLN